MELLKVVSQISESYFVILSHFFFKIKIPPPHFDITRDILSFHWCINIDIN